MENEDLQTYYESLKLTGYTPEPEDFYGAGFDEESVSKFFSQQERMQAKETDPAFEGYSPTVRDKLRVGIQQRLVDMGLDKSMAYHLAYSVAGSEQPTDGSLGIGLADFSPLGLPMGAQEGTRAVQRGVDKGDYLEAGLGGLEAALSVAGAIPGVKATGKYVSKTANKMADEYDPSVMRTFFGPDAKGANLDDLEAAKDFKELGASPEEIWTRFGWFEGPNGWKFEVDDSNLRLRPTDSTRMADVIDHPEFFDNLDSKSFENARFTDNPDDYHGAYGESASFNPDTKEIIMYLSADKGTLVHEMQHAIQNRFLESGEGYSPGAAADDLYKMMDNLGPAGSRLSRSLMDYGALTLRYDLHKTDPVMEKKLSGEMEDILRFISEDSKEVPNLANNAEDFVTLGRNLAALADDGQELFSKGKLRKPYAQAFYELEAGEAEARMAGSRANMSSGERSMTLPKTDVDSNSIYTKDALKKLFNKSSEPW